MYFTNSKGLVDFVSDMLISIGYEKVEMASGKPYDITAVKDDRKYCFKCQHDIDAISEKKMLELVEGTANTDFDERVFVTDSSFISSAKKLGDREGILLWDRNTVDRMYIAVKEKFPEPVYEDTKNTKGLIIGIATVVILAIAAAAYFFIIR